MFALMMDKNIICAEKLSLLSSCVVVKVLAVHFLAAWERLFQVLAEERVAAGVVADYYAEQ
jgi:hypothetical protein